MWTFCSTQHIIFIFLCTQKIKILLVPTRDWGPALVQHRQLIKHVPGFTEDPKDTTQHTEFAYQNMSEPTRRNITGVTVSSYPFNQYVKLCVGKYSPFQIYLLASTCVTLFY